MPYLKSLASSESDWDCTSETTPAEEDLREYRERSEVPLAGGPLECSSDVTGSNLAAVIVDRRVDLRRDVLPGWSSAGAVSESSSDTTGTNLPAALVVRQGDAKSSSGAKSSTAVTLPTVLGDRRRDVMTEGAFVVGNDSDETSKIRRSRGRGKRPRRYPRIRLRDRFRLRTMR